jgi:hypothetical protein
MPTGRKGPRRKSQYTRMQERLGTIITTQVATSQGNPPPGGSRDKGPPPKPHRRIPPGAQREPGQR